jgi:WD40 repeat protein
VVAVWDAASGEALTTLTQDGAIYALAFSLDGDKLASGSEDLTARIWDFTALLEGADAHAAQLFVLLHDNVINGLAFSPDGAYLASASSDRTARLWDVATGQELNRIAEGAKIPDIAFAPSGDWLVAPSGSVAKLLSLQGIKLLQVDDLIPEACSRLTRNLTPDEWGQFIGDADPYRPLCPNLPDLSQ